MMRFLWKEIRERWIMHLIWSLSIITISLINYSKYFFNIVEYSSNMDFIYIAAILGIFTGGGAYTSELVKDRISFVYSRPVQWWQMLIAKLIPGIAVIIISPLIAFMLYYISGPSCYHPFITFPNVINGFWQIIWPNALFFIFGFLCSAVLPGFASGFVTLTIVLIYVLIILAPVFDYLPNWLIKSRENIILTSFAITIPIGIIIAFIQLIRHDIRSILSSRVLYFLKTISIFIVIALIYGFWGKDFTSYLYTQKTVVEIVSCDFSNNGRYVNAGYANKWKGKFEENYKINYSTDFYHAINLETGEKVQLIPDSLKNNKDITCNAWWIGDDTVIINASQKNVKGIAKEPIKYIHQISTNITRLALQKNYPSINYYASPDGKYLLTIIVKLKDNKIIKDGETPKRERFVRSFQIYYFPEMRIVATINDGIIHYNFYWKDNKTFSYINKNGKYKELHLNQIVKEDKK